MRKINLLWMILLMFFISGCGNDIKPASSVITEPQPQYIEILTCGDNLYHMPVIKSGLKEDGSYDYSFIYNALQPMIKNADISVIGQETVFAGKDQGYSGYPLFNSPDGVGETIAREGFDVVLHASNHVMDKYASGIERTLSFWENYPHITVIGINKSEEDREVNIRTIKGVKIAMLNYTYDTNGIPVPSDKSYLVELINEENIKNDAEYAEENADFTIAFMHWGTEYSTAPNDRQKSLSRKMADWGVDLIVGSHPHVIEPVEWVTGVSGNKTLVYYSLGNFVSRQLDAINLLGGISRVILKEHNGEVTIDNYSFMPVVTHYNQSYSGFKVYPLSEYTNELAASHGVASHDGAVSVERFQGMVDKVFEGYDKSIIE